MIDRSSLAGGHHGTPHDDGGRGLAGCDHIATTQTQWIINFHLRRHTRPNEATAFPQVEMAMGGSLVSREPPISPSGRQDLNLRPLDPQYGRAIPLTCGNAESAAQASAARRTSSASTPAGRDPLLHNCSSPSGQWHRPRAPGSVRSPLSVAICACDTDVRANVGVMQDDDAVTRPSSTPGCDPQEPLDVPRRRRRSCSGRAARASLRAAG
jgi:hypothetical protein